MLCRSSMFRGCKTRQERLLMLGSCMSQRVQSIAAAGANRGRIGMYVIVTLFQGSRFF